MPSLLVTTSLGERPRYAFYRAPHLAWQIHWQLTVRDGLAKAWPDKITRRLQADVEESVTDPLEKMREKGDLGLILHIRQGKGCAAISCCAEATHGELTLRRLHLETRFPDRVIGTPVDCLIRLSSRPILVVTHRPRHSCQNILVALDFSGCAWAALLTLMLFPGATFHVVNAFTPACVGLNVDEDYHQALRREHQQDIKGRLRDVIRQMLPQSAGQPLNLHPVFEAGGPVEMIHDTCARLKPDLLEVRAHGTTGPFLLGGVATALRREPPTGILVVRA